MNGLCVSKKYEEFYSEKPFDLANRSSIGCGGKADVAFYPRNIDEACRLLDCLREDGLEYAVVGNLTNVLPCEELKKVVICTKKMNAVRTLDGSAVFAEAGATSGKLLAFAKNASLSGAEFLIGIPCTLGGALYMNAGVNGRYIEEIVKSVTVYHKGERKEIPVHDCDYSYKHSAFMQNGDVILGAKLRLKESDPLTICENECYWFERRAHLPKGKSMGCVFKNAGAFSAGALIDGAGLKGLRFGGAKISEEHANFIVNDENATSFDVRKLIEIVKISVFEHCGVHLEEEIRYLE